MDRFAQRLQLLAQGRLVDALEVALASPSDKDAGDAEDPKAHLRAAPPPAPGMPPKGHSLAPAWRLQQARML